MIVALQTNVAGQLSTWLIDSSGEVLSYRHKKIQPGESRRTLELLDQLISRKEIRAVTAILVVCGPGPFTPVRTGLVVANTLGYALSIPVVGIRSAAPLLPSQLAESAKKISRRKKSYPPRPWYGRSPNISRPRQLKATLALPRGDRGRARTVSKLSRRPQTTA